MSVIEYVYPDPATMLLAHTRRQLAAVTGQLHAHRVTSDHAIRLLQRRNGQLQARVAELEAELARRDVLRARVVNR